MKFIQDSRTFEKWRISSDLLSKQFSYKRPELSVGENIGQILLWTSVSLNSRTHFLQERKQNKDETVPFPLKGTQISNKNKHFSGYFVSWNI